MSDERSSRSLNILAAASSSRVLNLVAIAHANADNPGHGEAPLFLASIFNQSLILKHRPRAGEVDLFDQRRAIATKIIIPFERRDLKSGGHSMFIDQRGFEELVREVGNYRDPADLKRDLAVMRMIDGVPSLDPFLLREHLRCSDIHPDDCYFAVSETDRSRMHDYTAQEISRLATIANGGRRASGTGRMATALLSGEGSERLEPLRLALGMRAPEFREGMFSGRGFIYYKWCLEEIWPAMIRALKGIRTIAPIGRLSPEERAYLESRKNIILRAAKSGCEDIRKIIAIYDSAYAGLVEKREPKPFRDFLLGAPQLFLDIGERMGAISHITGFWNHGFPMGAPRTVDAPELIAIFQDFHKCLTRGEWRGDGYGIDMMDSSTDTAMVANTTSHDGSFAATSSAKLAAASAASRQLVMALVQSGE